MSAEVSIMPVSAGQASGGKGISPDNGPTGANDDFSSLLAQSLAQKQTGTAPSEPDISQLLASLSSAQAGAATQNGTENPFLTFGNMLPQGKLPKQADDGEKLPASELAAMLMFPGVNMSTNIQPTAVQLPADASAQALSPAMQWQGMVAYSDSAHPEGVQYFFTDKDQPGGDARPFTFLPVQDGDQAKSLQIVDPSDTRNTKLAVDQLNLTDVFAKPAVVNSSAHPELQANQFMLAMQGQGELPDAKLSQDSHTSDSQSPMGIGMVYTQQTSNFSHAQLPPMGITPNQPGWGDALGNRVNWLVNNHFQQADIRLDPPDLGSLDVRIRVTGQDQIANITFSSPHAQVRDAVEHALPRLREMFADAGLTLGDVNVSHQSMQDNRHPSQHMAGDFNQGSPRGQHSSAIAGIEPKETEGIGSRLRQGAGLLDTYA